MVQLRSVFRALAVQGHSVAEVLRRVNTVACSLTEESGMFATACYACYEQATRRLSTAVAGHPAPVLRRCDGSCAPLTAVPGTPLGITSRSSYEAGSLELQPGDRLVLYTDGLVERRGEHLDTSLERLCKLVSQHVRLAAQPTADALAGGVEDREDDIAVLVVDVA
jgi:serine phosphatase RsbU (regulator of sigma subunit)